MSSIPSSKDDLFYRTATICRLTGYSPLVLRAWERRYGLLCPVRAPSGHRLYTQDDLKVLRLTREMTSHGMRIGEVAALGRATLTAPGAEDTLPRWAHARRSAPTGPIDARDLSDLCATLTGAAMSYDEKAVATILDDAFCRIGEERIIADLIGPLMTEVGTMWAAGRLGVGAEKVISHAVRQRVLLQATTTARTLPPTEGRLVVCACVEREQHDLGALSLVLEFSRRSFATLYLGPAIPIEEVDAACAIRAPLAVCLSFKQAEHLDPHRNRLRRLAADHPRVLFVMGGDGVIHPDPGAPTNLAYLPGATLDDAITRVAKHAAVE